MRPRKQIMLWCADDGEAADLRCVLELRLPVRVFRFETREEALALMSARAATLDGALVVEARKGDGAELVANFLVERRGEIMGRELRLPVLLFDPLSLIGDGHCAERLIQGGGRAELLEGLRVLCARKRGPRKVEAGRVWDGLRASVAMEEAC